MKSSILRWYDDAKTTLKDSLQKEANLMPQEHERALQGAHKSCVIPRLSKSGIEGYADQVKLHVKALVEGLLKEMQSTKVTL